MENRIPIASYVRQNQIISYVLILGQIIFAGCSILLATLDNKHFDNDDLIEVFKYFVPLLTLYCISGGFVFFKHRMKLLRQKTNLIEKLAEYRSSLIIRWALFEATSLFAIVVYIITGKGVFLGVVLIVIGIFIMLRPSRANMENDLDLSWEEKKQLE